jgi:hypothetical protein
MKTWKIKNSSIIRVLSGRSNAYLILNGNNIILVDTGKRSAFGRLIRNSAFPPYAVNISEMIESWGKLLDTDCKIFLPGHGGEIKRNLLKKEYEKYNRKNYLK